MEKAVAWKEIAMESLTKVWFEISSIFPNIIGTIVVLIIGWLFAKLAVRIIKKVLILAKADKLDATINDIEIIEGKKLNFNTIKTVSIFVKWLIYIMLLIMASDILGLEIISNQISDFLSYLPKLFAALIVFIAGLLFANIIKKGLKSLFESMELSGSKIISQIVFFILLIFISITALNLAGIDTEIITNNVTMILGSLLLAFSLAFGIGANKVVGDLLRTFYARKTYEIGQIIEFNNVKGEVVSIDGITITLKTASGKFIIPIKDIVESQVRVQD
ncbi:mechanosensitive ion channel-like protein [Mariniflexile fucanivorans]|uniref:Mechanosensitive ion channel-like protein n=1 Tax=Mariniflexile fucanivorans TaxID=264023 RepID=A0A4R1RBF8_9FLAO|nr:mechanosensitive ion channel domain-containing protein [Mariniflexile fucanivorans]TCL63076.1 mechanosensitive ion channel-like protein [Mariniflexile fucanivorans]